MRRLPPVCFFVAIFLWIFRRAAEDAVTMIAIPDTTVDDYLTGRLVPDASRR